MKKSLIALAVASALPVAAQADVTVSGSVEVKYANSPTWAIESDVDISASEVLANGMTATAFIDISEEGTTTSSPKGGGAVSLSGDFGALSLGNESDVQSGADVGDVADQIAAVLYHGFNTTDSTAATQTGLSYSGSFSGFDVALNTGENADNKSSGTLDNYSSIGAAYTLNDLTVGFAQLDNSGTITSALGASYSFGDLTVSGGNSGGNTKVKGAYEGTFEDLSVIGSISSVSDNTNTWEIEATYTMGSIAVTATAERDKPSALEAVYTSGAITATAKKDSLELDYDMGNADINVKRVSKETTASYKVSF
jgi:predicted porin